MFSFLKRLDIPERTPTLSLACSSKTIVFISLQQNCFLFLKPDCFLMLFRLFPFDLWGIDFNHIPAMWNIWGYLNVTFQETYLNVHNAIVWSRNREKLWRLNFNDSLRPGLEIFCCRLTSVEGLSLSGAFDGWFFVMFGVGKPLFPLEKHIHRKVSPRTSDGFPLWLFVLHQIHFPWA